MFYALYKEFVNGLRVTDEETMEIAEMVLNKVNKSLVNMVEELGVSSVGISGKDGGLLKVEKKYSGYLKIGREFWSILFWKCVSSGIHHLMII